MTQSISKGYIGRPVLFFPRTSFWIDPARSGLGKASGSVFFLLFMFHVDFCRSKILTRNLSAEREGFFFKTGCGGWSEGFPPVTQSGLKETQETAVGPLAFFNRRSRDGSQADLGDPCCYYSTASPTNRFEATKQKDKGSKIYVWPQVIEMTTCAQRTQVLYPPFTPHTHRKNSRKQKKTLWRPQFRL